MKEDYNKLLEQYEELKLKLEEAEATIDAIRNGEVDALVVEAANGTQIYTLEGAEQPYHILVDNLTEGAVTISEDKVILYCNKSFAQITGYSLDEIIGKPIINFISKDFSSYLVNGNLEQYDYPRNFSLIDKNNKSVPVLLSATSLKFRGFMGYGLLFTNMTEYLAVSRERMKLAAIVESSDDGIYSISTCGDVLNWNKGAEVMFGYRAFEMIGQNIRVIFPDNRMQEFESLLSDLASGKKLRHYETERKRKDGVIINVSLTFSTLMDDEEMVYGYAITARDITEKKKAEDNIRKLNEELETKVLERTRELSIAFKDVESFSYSVSHDLRAPLRRVDAFSKIIQQKYINELDNTAKEYFNFIIENISLMHKLIDSLLTFSRLTVKSVEKKTVDFTDLVKGLVSELNPAFENRKIQFLIDVLPDSYCDPAMIKQVWINLMSNALKFTRLKEQTIIQIGGIKNESECVYTIKDNGAGFDMKYSKKLFTVFQRLHTDEEFEGTGVGLALVARIINKHGGRVWGEGEVNKGASFSFSLPNHISTD